jgi:hypothetical protein
MGKMPAGLAKYMADKKKGTKGKVDPKASAKAGGKKVPSKNMAKKK